MPTFQYKAKDPKGKLMTGTLEAENQAAAGGRLQAMGYFPLSISGGEDQAQVARGGSGLIKRRIKVRDLSEFYRQMSDLVGSGVPLVKALSIVKVQTSNPRLTAVLTQISSDVQGGDTFASAMRKHSDVFNSFAVALVRAGETGGLLNETMERLAIFTENQDEVRSEVKSALAYPIIMIVVGTLAVGALLTFVMPRIIEIFDSFDQALPAITQFTIAVSYFMRDYWWVILLVLGAIYFVFRKWVQSESGQYQFHTFLMKVPVLGDLLLINEVAAFARTLGSLLQNGVAILKALDIASGVITLAPVREQIDKMPESITQGSGMAPTLRSSNLFPPVVVNMVAVGEETGNLAQSLTRVANSYELQLMRTVKIFTSLLGPVIILVLGLVVGFIVISLLLPIFLIDPSAG